MKLIPLLFVSILLVSCSYKETNCYFVQSKKLIIITGESNENIKSLYYGYRNDTNNDTSFYIEFNLKDAKDHIDLNTCFKNKFNYSFDSIYSCSKSFSLGITTINSAGLIGIYSKGWQKCNTDTDTLKIEAEIN
jgi:hypothetical protein